MANRRFHYDRAFEHYLRANAIPYVAVDEAKRALAPGIDKGATLKLKSFDFATSSDARFAVTEDGLIMRIDQSR